MTEPDRWLYAGLVGRPHGLDGSFHVSGAAAFRLLEPGREVRVGEEVRRVERLAGHAGGPIVRLDGSVSRADAEALRGRELHVAREVAPELEEDEWWAADLEGLAVRDGEEEVGVVARLLELPSCEVLEVERAGGGPALLVPLVTDAVRDVDLERGVVDVDLRFLGER